MRIQKHMLFLGTVTALILFTPTTHPKCKKKLYNAFNSVYNVPRNVSLNYVYLTIDLVEWKLHLAKCESHIK